MNSNSFIRIYKNLAENIVINNEEIVDLYWDLQDRIKNLPDFICKAHNKSHNIKERFEKSVPERLDACLAIDAVAHGIHQGGEEVLHKIFPSADYQIIKAELDALAGNDIKSPIRQYNRDYFVSLFDDTKESIVLLEKQEKQVGKTIKEDILPAIKEYENLFNAKLASPAEILTLYRFYPNDQKYYQAVVSGGLDREENEPMVVGGPASVEMIDREGHLITAEALDNAFRKFMDNFRARNIQILHSDCQVGWALPAYISKNGTIYKSGVDDKQLWLISEVRNDTEIAKRVKEQIKAGELRSYSIAGSGTNIVSVVKNGQKYNEVRELEMQECTFCLVPETKIWTKQGLKEIQNVTTDDFVWTHQNRWKKVSKIMNRVINENILEIKTSENKEIKITKEHPVRKLVSLGKYKGVEYQWIPAGELKIDDSISTHNSLGNCPVCNIPLFKNKRWDKHKYCSTECFKTLPPNRKGKTVASGDLGAELRNKDLLNNKILEFTNNKLVRIRDIEEIPYSGFVYNLEVEEDNSYTTDACVVHNCSRGMNPGANFDILKSVPEEINVVDNNELINKICDLDIILPDFAIYFDDENKKIIVKTERTNSITESIIKELSDKLGLPVVIVSSDLLTGEEIPVFRIGLEPIGYDEENSLFVDVTEIIEDPTDKIISSLKGEQKMSKSAIDTFNDMLKKQVKGKKTKLNGKDMDGQMDVLYAYDERLKKFRELLKELGFPEEKKTIKEATAPRLEGHQIPWIVNEMGESKEMPLKDKLGSKSKGNRLSSLDF